MERPALDAREQRQCGGAADDGRNHTIAVASFIAIPERAAALLPDLFATPVMRGLAWGLVFFRDVLLTLAYSYARVSARVLRRSVSEPAAMS